MSLPARFAEFYSDVGAFSELGVTAAVSLAEDSTGLFTTDDVVVYRVIALLGDDTNGPSAFSQSYAEQTILVTGGATGILVSWPSVTGAQGYRVYRSKNSEAWMHFWDVWAGLSTLDEADFWNNHGEATFPLSPPALFSPADGESVSKLEDQSGNARHLLQATAANRPTVNAAGALNGHTPINFNGGTDKRLSLFGLSGLGIATIFLVVKPTVSATDLNAYRFEAGGLNGQASTGWTIRGTSSGNPHTDLGGGAPAAVAQIVVSVFNGAASSVQLNSGAPVTGSISSHSPASLELRGHTNGMSFYAFVAYASVLTAPQIAAEVARLQTRYAL